MIKIIHDVCTWIILLVTHANIYIHVRIWVCNCVGAYACVYVLQYQYIYLAKEGL